MFSRLPPLKKNCLTWACNMLTHFSFFFPLSSLSQYSELWRCCAMTSVCYQKKVRHHSSLYPLQAFTVGFPTPLIRHTNMRPKFSGFDTHTSSIISFSSYPSIEENPPPFGQVWWLWSGRERERERGNKY